MSAAEKIPNLYTEAEAARRLGVSKATLTRERIAGRIGAIRMGERIIRYTDDILSEYQQHKSLSVETLMSQAEAARTPVEDGIGVYVLWSGDEIIYIGKSARFHTRLASHLLTPKEFDSYAFVPVHPALVDLAEQMLIRHFKPVHNTQYVRPYTRRDE